MEIKLPGKSMFYGADSKTFEAATILRKNMTLPELILWKKLRDKSLFKVKFRRQHPIDIFIVDFYCHKYKLVIEID
jgi:very-short-patch-repair endonuclease